VHTLHLDCVNTCICVCGQVPRTVCSTSVTNACNSVDNICICCEFRGHPHDQFNWGSAVETNHRIYQGNLKKRRRRYSKVDRKPTNNIMWFHRSNRPCVRLGDKGRNFIKTLGEYNKNYLHLTLRIYKPLMYAKNSEPLWLSFVDTLKSDRSSDQSHRQRDKVIAR